MKYKRIKCIALIMVTVLIMESAKLDVLALGSTTNTDGCYVTNVEGKSGLTDSDVICGTSDGNDVTAGNAPDENGTVGGNLTGNDAIELFPGLPANYALSKEQMADKAELANYVTEIAGITNQEADEGYVPGQVIYLTDIEKEAQEVADAFGGTLESYALGVAVIALPENRTVVQAVAASANMRSELPAVWPNYYMHTCSDYTDPALKDSSANYQWQHKFVGSKTAWENGYTGKGVKVGIIDTGVLNAHEEFSGRVVKHVDLSGSSVVYESSDKDGHGTHVTGIVAASADNGVGGAGIAPEASIYVYGVADKSDELLSAAEDRPLLSAAVYRAINQAVNDGIDIINMSFSHTNYSAQEQQIINSAYKNGVTIFASINPARANTYSYPASCDNVYSIAALQQDGRLAYFSECNDKIRFAFPGCDIYSTSAEGSNKYTFMTGTSMATAVATGVAAVILSGTEDIPSLKGKKGSAKVEELIKIMENTAFKCSDKGTGAGTTYLPDVWGLTVNEMDEIPAAPYFDLPDKSTISDTSYQLKISSKTTEGVTIYYNCSGETPAFKNGQVVNGYPYNGESLYLSGQKSRTVKAIAVNHRTGKASKVAEATYYFEPAPESVSVTCANNTDTVVPGSKITLKASVYPSYAASTKVVWSVQTTAGAVARGITVKDGKVTVGKDAAKGKYYVVATVEGVANAKASAKKIQGKYALSVQSDSKKVKKITFEEKKLTATTGKTVNLLKDVTVTYADGSTAIGAKANVVFSTSNANCANVDKSTGVVTVYQPGKVTIKATVNDGSNKSASCAITVTQPATEAYIYKAYGERDKGVLAAGTSTTLYVGISPDNVSSKNVDWKITSSRGTNGKVTIDKKGKVSASKDATGTYTITATTKDGSNVKATYKLTIISDAVEAITMEKKIQLFIADASGTVATKKLNAQIKGGRKSEIYYYSSNSSVVSVDQAGNVYAQGSGKATVYCIALDGSNKKAACAVTVSVPMSSIRIVPANDCEGTVYVGDSIKLNTVIGSAYGVAQNRKVKWSVAKEDEDKVSISSKGVVKAKSLGRGNASGAMSSSATIYAEAADGSGAKGQYTIQILPKIKSVKFVKVSQESNNKVSSSYCIRVTYENGVEKEIGNYRLEVSAPKGYKPSLLEGTDPEHPERFGVAIDKATTTKTSLQYEEFSRKDAIPITIKAKILGSKKTAKHKLYMIVTTDGVTFLN